MNYRPIWSAVLALGALTALPASVAAKDQKPPPADPQTLVNTGKRPAFYDPNDLSKPPVLSAKSALLMDADTGQILWEKNGAVRRAPASTTKILTALLFIEHTQPDDIITCMDPRISRIEESSLHIKPWEKFRAEDLLYGLMLRSANDGAVVIAQHVAGSVPRFADRMTARARELGATDSQFKNPNGLTESGHYSTARDLALISRAALANPRFADAVGVPRRIISRSKVKNDIVVASKGGKFYDKFPGADGVKTGYTRAAGHCFVGSATREGRRLISVVLGARSSATGETFPLLGWGFRRFPAVWLARRGEAMGAVGVRGGVQREVPVVAGEDLQTTTDALLPAAAVKEIVAAPVTAPITIGQEVGRLVAKVNGQEVGSVPLLAAADIAQTPLAAGATSPWGRIALTGMGAGLLTLGVRVGTTAAKSARRRRRRLTAARRGVNSLR